MGELHPAIVGDFLLGEAVLGFSGEGYALYLQAGQSPDPDTLTPIATAGPTENSCVFDVAALGLLAGQLYVMAVYAVLAAGHSDDGAEASFRAASGGTPALLPTPVMDLDVVIGAGGAFRLSWVYEEMGGVAADEFRAVITPEDGGAAIVVDLAAAAGQREYSLDMTAAEGRYRATVISRAGGVGDIEAAPSIEFQTDATAPAGSIAGLTAV